jgi:hypothetical protein
VIAKAAKTSGELLAHKMKAMAKASRELERGKIDVLLKLFVEQMDYQREKDKRLYKNTKIAQENARLSIIKQGEVVQALSKLFGVLRTGLFVTPDSKNNGLPGAGLPVPHGDPNLDDCTSALGRLWSEKAEV